MNTTTAHRHPHRRLALLLLLTTVSFSLLTPAGAQVVAPVPSVINYQGRVTDGTGLPIGASGSAASYTPGTTNRKIIFRIYDAATAGTRLWTEEQTVTISTGEFSVLLGSGIDATGTAAGESRPSLEAVFSSIASSPGGARFLEIMVDEGGGTIDGSDVPISPRQQLTTTAYSFRAKSADSIASGSDLQLNSSSNYGLGYYGSGRTFNGTALDGPVLYGLSGGALGSVNGASQSTALRWNAAGQVGVGSADLSGADATSKLILQGDDSTSPPKHLTIRGNTTNKRLYVGYNTTGNYGALQAYNGTSATTNLLLNPIGSTVGIGTTNPTSGAKLEVNGSISAAASITGTSLNLPATSSSTVGLINSNGTPLIHAYGTNNFFAGQSAGNFTLTGTGYNVGVGYQALSSLTSGNFNTALGINALEDNTSGSENTAVGRSSLSNNTTGNSNSAFGSGALAYNTTGYQNTGVGEYGLFTNTTGKRNTAVGYTSLEAATSADDNTAVGHSALSDNTSGFENTATGSNALGSNTTGHYNTAMGVRALRDATTGQFNTAIGREALASLTTISQTTPLVPTPWRTTPSAPSTRPLATGRSLPIPRVNPTLPLAMGCSSRTPLVPTTRQWAKERSTPPMGRFPTPPSATMR